MIYKIKDDDGKEYEIKDIEKFAKHVFEFHSTGSSLHEENGFCFTINDALREKIAELIKKKKT